MGVYWVLLFWCIASVCHYLSPLGVLCRVLILLLLVGICGECLHDLYCGDDSFMLKVIILFVNFMRNSGFRYLLVCFLNLFNVSIAFWWFLLCIYGVGAVV